MSDEPIKHDSIIEPKVFQPAADSADVLLEKLSLLIGGFRELAKITGAKINSGIDPKTIGDVDKLAQAKEKLANIEKGLNETQKIEIQIQQVRNEQRKAERELLKGQVSAYQELQNKYNEARKKAQDLIITEGLRNKTTQEAVKQTNLYNQRLKEIDATLGNHQRNVGNYGGAIQKLSKGLAGLTGLFSSLGNAIGLNTTMLEQAHQASRELIKVAREIGHAKELETVVHVENTAAVEAETVVHVENTAAVEAETVAHVENTAAVEAETVAHEALAVSELGIVGLIGGIVALGAAIAAYMINRSKANELERESQIAVDGTIIANKEERDSYNDLQLAMASLMGVQSELAMKHKIAVQNIKDDTAGALAEAQTNWKSFLAVFDSGGGAGVLSAIEKIKIFGEEASKLRTLQNTERAESTRKFEERLQKFSDDVKKEKEDKEKADAEKKKQALKDADADLKKEAKAFFDFWDKEDAKDAKKAAEKEKQDADQRVKDIHAQLDANKEVLDKQIKDLEDNKKEELRIKKEQDDLLREYENNQQDMADEDRKEALRKEKELLDKRAVMRKQNSDTIFKGLEIENEKEQQLNENKLTELDKQMEFQKELALAGQANTYAELQKERAKALDEQARLEKQKARDKEAQNLAETFLAFYKIYAAEKGGNAFTKALTATAKGKAGEEIVKAMAGSFFEGTEDTGGPGSVDSKGGKYAILHPHEGVVTAEGKAEVPGLVTAINESGLLGAIKWMIPKMPVVQDMGVQEQVNKKLMEMTLKEIKGLRSDMAEKEDVTFKENTIEQIVKIRSRQGIIEQTTYRPVPGSYAKN